MAVVSATAVAGTSSTARPPASAGPAHRRAGHQHELPTHVTVLADAVRLRDLGEREGPRDREREAPDSISSPISVSAWTARPASPC